MPTSSAQTTTVTRTAGRPERVDTAHLVETPEGVDFQVRPAGPIPRFWAAVIDIAIRTGILLATGIALSMLGTVGSGIQMIVAFAAIWGYPIAFEMWWNGQTPGKKWCDLQVRQADGTPVTWRGSIVRNLLRAADFLPVGYLIGLVATVTNRRFQRIGDLAGDTIVCHTDTPDDLAELDLPDADPLPVPVRLTPDEQAAVVRFAVRSTHWSPERCREIAGEASGLTGGGQTDSDVDRLQRMASAIVQGR